MRRVMFAAYAAVLLFSVMPLMTVTAAAEDYVPPGMMRIADEYMVISTSGQDTDVPFIVTDPQGRKYGYDPRNDEWHGDFTASFEMAVARHYASDRFENEMTFNLELTGEYTITVIGQTFDDYNIGVSVRSRGRKREDGWPGNKLIEKNFYLKLFPIDKGLMATYKVTYNGKDALDATTFEKVSTVDSLRQDLKLFRRWDTIKNDGVLKSLLQKLDAIEASIARGNKTAAQNQIDAFMNEVVAQAGKHIDDTVVSDPNHLSTAKRLLKEAHYLKDHL